MLYLLEQMKEEFYPLTSQKNQTIDIQVSEDLIVYVDPQKMARVFNNILKNAFHYSYENTVIHIQAYQDESYTHVVFENQGNTIPPDKIQNIFKQFIVWMNHVTLQLVGQDWGYLSQKQLLNNIMDLFKSRVKTKRHPLM